MTRLIAVLALALALPARAGILSDYTHFESYSIHVPEASGVTYNRDTNTLFAIGDEGEALYQLSLTGGIIDMMYFDNGRPRPNRALDDPEGITYLGNGKFMIADERIGTGWVTSYAAGTTVGLGVMPAFVFEGTSGANVGLEGIAYDPKTDSVWGVKESGPVSIYQQSNITNGGTSTTSSPFPGNRFTRQGITSLSDIYILAASEAYADEMSFLVLTRSENKIFEYSRTGDVLSQLDISSIGRSTIEGMTMDNFGNLYLVAEGSITSNDDGRLSALYVFSPASVPEPSTYALLGIATLGAAFCYRRKRKLAAKDPYRKSSAGPSLC